MNQIRAFTLLAFLSVLLLVVGFWISEHAGLLVALVVVVFMNINSLLFTEKLVLKMFSATKADSQQHGNLLKILKSVSEKAGISAPSLYITNTAELNGFSVGVRSKKTAIVLTKGSIDSLDESMLTAIITYLVSQIQQKNTLANTVATGLAHGIFGFLNPGLWKKTFGIDSGEKSTDEEPFNIGGRIARPLAAFFVRVIVSKHSAYHADLAALTLCDDGLVYMQTLERLETERASHAFLEADMHPSTTNLFMINPLRDAVLSRYFSLFPSTKDRITQLKNCSEVTA